LDNSGADAGEPSAPALSRCGCPTSRRSWMWLGIRCLGGFCCIIMEYSALQELPLAVNTMIVYSSPAFIVLWAAVLFREPVALSVVVCLGLCFAGVLLIVRPWNHSDPDTPFWAYVLSLASAMFAGLVYLSLRELKGVSYHAVLNWFQGSNLVLAVVVGALLHDLYFPPAGSGAWVYLVAVAVTAYAAEVCITVGYAFAGTSIGQVSVLKFLSPIFSLMWGILFLGSGLQGAQIAGSCLVFAASATIVYLKTAHGEDDDKPAACWESESGTGSESDTAASQS